MTWIRASAALVAAGLALPAAGCGSTAGNVAAASGKPFVADVRGTTATIYAAGDGPPGPGAAAVARLIAHAKPGRFLYLGDVYPMGTADAYRKSYAPTYGAFATKTAPTPANHDWPDRAKGYDAYWRETHGTTPPPWYSFRAGGWTILSLNSETDDKAGQLRWLRRQLTGRTPCRLAFWHRPRFSAGLHGDSPDVEPLWHALAGH